MTDNDIIKEATEAVRQNLDCSYAVPHLLNIIKHQKEQINGLQDEVVIKTDMLNTQKAEIERLKSINQTKLDKIYDLEKRIEKQTPKKPLWKKYSGETRCPRCNTFVLLHNKHCIECGQAIDWSEAGCEV